MDSKLRKQLLEMLIRYGVRGETDIAQIPFVPQKTDCFLTRTVENTTNFSTPEAEGVSSLLLCSMLRALEQHKAANIQTVSIYRHGKLISEATARGYSATTWRATHSMAKTITAIAIGQLIDQGKLSLSDKITDILPKECPIRMHKYIKEITVFHLLSMSSGVVGLSESTSVVEKEWTKAFFESTPLFQPGTAFKYNSMNTYMLGVILEKITGQSLSEYLREHLFGPLSISHFLCENSPEGKAKAGWGMYISPRDMAKIGQLLLQKGQWKGKTVVSEKCVNLMLKKTFQKEGNSLYHYGLHIWLSPDESSFLLSGMLGQNVWVCPKTDVVAVVTAGNSELFEKADVLKIISDTLGNPEKISETPIKKQRKHHLTLKQVQNTFWDTHAFVRLKKPKSPPLAFLCRLFGKAPNPLPEALAPFAGNYTFEKNNTGLFPLFCRFMQNNHTKGLSRLRFLRKNNRFFVIFEEGVEIHTIEVGFYTPAEGQLNFGGEAYLVSAMGECALSEDNLPVLKIDLVFPELPNRRRIKIFSENGTMRVCLTELPGKEMIEGLVSEFVPEPLRAGGIMSFLRAKMFGVDPFTCIGPMTEPTLRANKE